MAPIARAGLLVAFASCAVAYKLIANCVPGPMMDIVGRPALYTVVLKVLMPAVYGDLKLIAVGENGPCMAAADAVNSNQLEWAKAKKQVLGNFEMKELGVLKAMKDYDNTSSYLYVFENLAFHDYELIADAVPGDIVGGLSFTEGKIALYTVALQTILPSLLGDLQFLGTCPNEECVDIMNKINSGNHTVYEEIKKKNSLYDIKSVGILKGMKVADNTTSYIYIFKNKLWNVTWDVMSGDGSASFEKRRLIA